MRMYVCVYVFATDEKAFALNMYGRKFYGAKVFKSVANAYVRQDREE